MALNLGGTIAEIKSRMTPREMAIWKRYRQKYGPMNDVRRYDRVAALIATAVNRSAGGKAKMQDFFLYGIESEIDAAGDDSEISLEKMMKHFGGVRKRGG